MGFFTHQHSTTSISTAFARIGPYKQSSASFSHSQIRHIKPYIVYPTRDEFRIPSTVLFAMPSSEMPLSLIPASNQWSNIAALSFAASLAQLLGKTTTIGRLLGAPIVAMTLTFGLSSLNIVPPINSASSWLTLLPSGGSPASTLLQTISLTLATPLLLLGTSLRGKALQKCSSLLGSFLIASLGTLIGAMVAVMIPSLFSILPSMMHASLPNGDGIKIAAALLAKNIGGGINYMAVCSCLGAAPESVAAGLCVDNVMSLLYFPLTSVLASKYDDTDDGATEVGSDAKQDETIQTESLSHALTIAVVLTALGQHLNSMQPNSSLNLSLPITTLLTVLFSTYYPSNWFLSPTSTKFQQTNSAGNSNGIAKAGEYVRMTILHEMVSPYLLITSCVHFSSVLRCFISSLHQSERQGGDLKIPYDNHFHQLQYS
jgi:hypothetical protein